MSQVGRKDKGVRRVNTESNMREVWEAVLRVGIDTLPRLSVLKLRSALGIAGRRDRKGAQWDP